MFIARFVGESTGCVRLAPRSSNWTLPNVDGETSEFHRGTAALARRSCANLRAECELQTLEAPTRRSCTAHCPSSEHTEA